MSHKQQPIPHDPPPPPHPIMKQLSGWIGFAVVMMVLGGVFNVIDGLAALTDADIFFHKLVIDNLQVVGWLATTLGVCQILIGFGVYRRNPLAQVFAVMLAGISAILHLLFIGHYPLWSVIIIVVDGLIIWALTAHADE